MCCADARTGSLWSTAYRHVQDESSGLHDHWSTIRVYRQSQYTGTGRPLPSPGPYPPCFFVIMSSVLLTRWGYVGDLKLLSELLHDADMKLFRCMLHSTHPLYSPITSALKYVLLLPLLPLHCVRKKRCHFIFACNAKC